MSLIIFIWMVIVAVMMYNLNKLNPTKEGNDEDPYRDNRIGIAYKSIIKN